MDREEAFIERILDARRRGAEAREREEEAIAEASAAMCDALGGMSAFAAMDSPAFPVTGEAVDSLEDSAGMPDFGAVVTAVMDGPGRCKRVYAQMRTPSGDEFMTISLHPARGELRWMVEMSSRAFDGADWNVRKEFRSAEKALAAVRTWVLGHAVRTASRGAMDSLPVLPEGDVAAAEAARRQVKAALSAGLEVETRRRRRAEEVARSANAIASIWDVAAVRLGFLSRVGYRMGSIEKGLGILTERTGSGVAVKIVSGESWSVLRAEALLDEPATAALRIEDSAGRSEARGQVPVADAALLASELEHAVLSEIEAAETAYLPENSPVPENAPSM